MDGNSVIKLCSLHPACRSRWICLHKVKRFRGATLITAAWDGVVVKALRY
jgi:hypothetical protein